ncbi:RagB/SusD family nutrient uptake outer membrane protein [Chryseobacterium sp. R2A-55]|uniref:RagB/SusD family nutrient uptake outer membrane protein n=1 Tax=Chryseobacterium sp. R2A-55 TaxID=2744445 RepID=UPI001F382E49|nr:RagB/SusD family nutrient uptake outer membrane protein [Chryseobacterium sp. R2A-55]
MKNIRNYIRTILFLSITSIISCEKMLEVDIPQNQIDRNLVFTDTQTANAALAALYSGVRDNSLVAGDEIGVFMSIYTDDVDCYATTATNGVYELYKNQLISSNLSIYAVWANTYQQIYLANSILEGVQNSSLATADKNRITGEALLVRSILHFYLQQIYGDIPYVNSTDYQTNSFIGKTSYSDVLAKLESDLGTCITLLNDDYSNVERIFVNRKVAELMLAKVYMAELRYGDAETKLKSIVQSPLYTFENDITKVFQKSGKHILWQLKPKNSGDATKEAGIYYFTNVAPSNYALSTNLVNSFASSDLRKQNWMATVTVGGNTWYRADKYKNRSNNTSEYSIVFRLEEVYLLLAETLAKQGKLGQALPYINSTRQRAGLLALPVGTSQAILLSEISNENRREFFTEMGHRFFDLKRNGNLSNLVSAKPNWQSFHQLWPIPQKDLQLNSNLNPQNPGY